MAKVVTIEILYFEGCPSHKSTAALVKTVVSECGIAAEIIETCVRNLAQAKQAGFSGSPTILVNGTDIEPHVLPAAELGCRLYLSRTGLRGVPPRELLQVALISATTHK